MVITHSRGWINRVGLPNPALIGQLTNIEEGLNEGRRMKRFNQSKKEENKQNKNKKEKITERQRKAIWHQQTKKRPEDISTRYLWLVNYGERTSTSTLALGYPLLGPCCLVRAYTTACRSPALAFSAAVHVAIKRSAPCSAVLRHSPSSWAAVVHWLALILKALRSSRRRHIHSISWPPTQPAPSTSSPNINHFGSLLSSMHASNPANRIRLLHTIALVRLLFR